MASTPLVFLGIVIDIFCAILVFVPTILVEFEIIEPYERGFFCDDESLKHPYKEDTIRTSVLIILGIVVPLVIILLVEAIRACVNSKKGRGPKKYQIGKCGIPMYIVRVYQFCGAFLFGGFAQQSTTDILKVSIGRLRPHFFDVCQPTMTNCTDEDGFSQFVTEYECRGTEHAHKINNARLSFASGHASLAAYAYCFLAIYLQYRMTFTFTRLLRPILQVGLIWVGMWIGVSRISDYKHHWSDVLGGALIGVIGAILISVCIYGKLFRTRIQILGDRVTELLGQKTAEQRDVTWHDPEAPMGERKF